METQTSEDKFCNLHNDHVLAAMFLTKFSTVAMVSSHVCSGIMIGQPQAHIHARVILSLGGRCRTCLSNRHSWKGAVADVLCAYCPLRVGNSWFQRRAEGASCLHTV